MSEEVLFDFSRKNRLGFNEAVLADGKSVHQLGAILNLLTEQGSSALLTRLSEVQFSRLAVQYGDRLDYDAVSETAFFDHEIADLVPVSVAIVTAGTSDIPVAREAERTLQYYGYEASNFYDIGVAGLWRLGSCIRQLDDYSIVIVVAGMDGALPSVIGGLLRGQIIAVPTSRGYGASEGGRTALMAALSSCAPGLVVVNIDNGYGAALAAIRAKPAALVAG